MRDLGRPKPPQIALRGASEDHTELSATEHTLGLALQLPDALAGDAELFAELGEGRGVTVSEPVAAYQDVPVTLGESLDGLLQGAHFHLPDDRPSNLGGALVLDQLSQLGAVAVRGEGLVEAGGVRHRALDVEYLADRPLQASCDLLIGGLAAQFGGELVVRAGHLADLVPHVYGDADGTALVRHRALHSLPYPPRGVSREPPATVRVELLDGPHQADVTLLDEILEGQPHPTIPLCDAHDEPQILLDQLLARPVVAGLGPLAQVDLLLVRQEVPLVDTREVPGDEVGSLRRPLTPPPVCYPNGFHQTPPCFFSNRLVLKIPRDSPTSGRHGPR